MKVFLIGMPQSGRTTVAKALAADKFLYINLSSVLNVSELSSDEKQAVISNSLKSNSNIFINQYRSETENFYHKIPDTIIDGIVSPRDFIKLFDYNEDVVVFLNRTDNQEDYQDYQNIAVAVIRDYCFWLSSANLLPKTRWFEFNFKMSGEHDSYLKKMGFKNTVFSVKSIKGVIVHLNTLLTNILESGDTNNEDML